MTEDERKIMEDIGLDGHYLFCTALQYISHGMVDLDARSRDYEMEMTKFLYFVEDNLHQNLTVGYENDDLDEGQVMRLDAYVDENMPQLMDVVSRVVRGVYQILRQYRSPAHCRYRTPDRYFVGYEAVGNYGGILHFEFVDHENHNQL